MNGLDLFSGIGGLTKALAGYVVPVAYCEIEPYARAVLLSRMATGELPLAPIWDDVTTIKGSDLPDIDIIYGGFPCQDISVAGRQKGLEGSRSSLFFEICRLAQETKAEWLFLENVPNIRTKGLGRVLKELDSIGYDCRWGILSAADVGANHKRERWFLLAHSRSVERSTGTKEPRIVCEVFRNGTEHDNTGGSGKDVANSESEQNGRLLPFRFQSDSGTGCGVGPDTNNEGQRKFVPTRSSQNEGTGTSERPGWWDVEPNVGRVANGVPKRVDRLRGLGNAVVPAQAREAFERLMGMK